LHWIVRHDIFAILEYDEAKCRIQILPKVLPL